MNYTAKEKRLISGLILAMIPLSGVGIDICAPSLPLISDAFHISHSTSKLSIIIYLFGFCFGQLFIGPLSDCLGRKKIVLLGLFFFASSSLLAVVIKSATLLLMARLIQGVSVSAPVVIAKSVATDCFVGSELKKISTNLVTAWSLGPIIAPVIGGYSQQYFGWKASFIWLFLYSLILLLTITIYMPETNKENKKIKIKIIISNYSEIITSNAFMGSVLCLAIGYAYIVAFNIVSPFIIQNELGFSVITYGDIALAMGFGCFGGSVLNRWLTTKYSQNNLINCGIAIILLTSLLMLILSIQIFNILTLAIPTFIMFACIGVIYPNCSAYCLSMFPKMAGSASAVMGVITILGTAIIGIAASFLSARSNLSISILYICLTIGIYLCFTKLVSKDKQFNVEEKVRC